MTRAVYITDEAPGAYPNGTRIIKTRLYDPVEVNPVGTKGKVLGSMSIPQEAREQMAENGITTHPYMYVIEWDPHPGVPVWTIGSKIERVQ